MRISTRRVGIDVAQLVPQASSRRSVRRAASTSVPASGASCRAISRPMPAEAPVIRAVHSRKSFIYVAEFRFVDRRPHAARRGAKTRNSKLPFSISNLRICSGYRVFRAELFPHMRLFLPVLGACMAAIVRDPPGVAARAAGGIVAPSSGRPRSRPGAVRRRCRFVFQRAAERHVRAMRGLLRHGDLDPALHGR